MTGNQCQENKHCARTNENKFIFVQGKQKMNKYNRKGEGGGGVKKKKKYGNAS